MRMKFRLLVVMLAAFFRKKNLSISQESILRLRVMPWDCVLRLMGNDRYYSFMDLGRIDLVLRMGWGRAMIRHRLNPFVISSYIEYKYSIKMFERVSLHTKVVYWDSRTMWMQHEFKRKDKTIASAISRNVVTTNNRIVTSSLIFLISDTERPLCPEKILRMIELGAK